MLPVIPFTDAFYNKLNLALKLFAKESKGDQVTFSIKGKNKEIQSIGTTDFDNLEPLIAEALELVNPEVSEYSQKLKDTYKDQMIEQTLPAAALSL